MQTLVCESPGNFEYHERPVPKPGKGEALIRIRKIGICGTDLHAFEGTQPYFKYPRVLGHEISAEFVEGDGDGFSPGEALTIMPYFYCNNCASCNIGKPNCCVNLKVCGVHQDGAMCEHLVVPFHSLVKGHGLSANELALVEPIAIGAHSIVRAQVEPNEYVLVIGAGPIGLGVMEMARLAGAKVIAVDVNSTRLEFCKTKLGVAHTLNPTQLDALESLTEITSGGMAPVVIDASGNLRAINNGFQYLAHGGRYVLVGLQKENISFSHPHFHQREGTLMSSRNATKKDFDHVINSMTTERIDAKKFISHKVGFEKVKEEFASYLDPKSGLIKVIIEL
jgi:2-desacetyl-2-hydroxyethyl bacteriochlorophyllide A dehydrogenase